MHPLLLCGIITCSAILVIVILVAIFMGQMIKGAQNVAQAQQTVQATDLSTIQGSATPVSEEELLEDVPAYEGQWLELSGTVGEGSAEIPQIGMVQGTMLVLSNGVVLTVLADAPAPASGQQIKAWGRAALLDISKLPVIGKKIAKEVEDPSELIQVMFYAKAVEVVEDDADTGAMDTDPAAEVSDMAPAADGSAATPTE